MLLLDMSFQSNSSFERTGLDRDIWIPESFESLGLLGIYSARSDANRRGLWEWGLGERAGGIGEPQNEPSSGRKSEARSRVLTEGAANRTQGLCVAALQASSWSATERNLWPDEMGGPFGNLHLQGVCRNL